MKGFRVTLDERDRRIIQAALIFANLDCKKIAPAPMDVSPQDLNLADALGELSLSASGRKRGKALSERVLRWLQLQAALSSGVLDGKSPRKAKRRPPPFTGRELELIAKGIKAGAAGFVRNLPPPPPPCEEENGIHNAQKVFRGWLEIIARKGLGATSILEGPLNERLKGLAPTVLFRSERLVPVVSIDRVEDLCVFVTGLILDARSGLASRVGHCTAPRCGRFRLSFGGNGRPPQYCNKAHQRKADAIRGAARVKAWRAKKRKTGQLSPGGGALERFG